MSLDRIIAVPALAKALLGIVRAAAAIGRVAPDDRLLDELGIRLPPDPIAARLEPLLMRGDAAGRRPRGVRGR